MASRTKRHVKRPGCRWRKGTSARKNARNAERARQTRGPLGEDGRRTAEGCRDAEEFEVTGGLRLKSRPPPAHPQNAARPPRGATRIPPAGGARRQDARLAMRSVTRYCA